MIFTLLITIVTEGVVITGYCTWRKKPIRPILLTGICANIITQSLLWVMLNAFFRQYLIALLIAEILIWLLEALALYSISANRLRFNEAICLSLSMNLVSFAFGWLLPI